MVFGEPDVEIKKQKDGQIMVEIKGVDVYDPTTGQKPDHGVVDQPGDGHDRSRGRPSDTRKQIAVALPAPGPRALANSEVCGRDSCEGDCSTSLRVYTGGELLAAQLPERNPVIVSANGDPIVRERDHVLLYAPRGSGKSWTTGALATCLSQGSPWARWKAARAFRVGWIDGEMPAGALRDRYEMLLAGQEPSGNLLFIMADVQDRPLPSLATAEGQAVIEPYIRDVEVLFLDHLSALFGRMAENDAEAWAPAQEWLLSLRRRGVTVFLVHHAGRSGQQRGTTKREDIADLIISLRQPADYVPEQGLRAEVHFEKARGLLGAVTEPFELQLRVVEGAASWTTREPEAETFDQVIELLRAGKSLRAIETATGISKSKVQRMKTRARERGLLA